MKKILLLTYFFPPTTFTASSRVYSWAKYLSCFGYFPVIITRKWKVVSRDYLDMSRSSGGEIEHEVFNNFEIFRLPYIGSYRDRLYVKFGDGKFRILRKILSLIEVVLSNISIRVLPYRNVYHFTDKYLLENPEINLILACGQPFTFFGFCHRLIKKHKIKWVADYRDDWNTSQWIDGGPLRFRILKWIESPTERKWLSSASGFTTISDEYVQRIGRFINKPGTCIMNGFDKDDYAELLNNKPFKEFTIIFNGTLYDTQPVEIFLEAYKLFINHLQQGDCPKLIFLGLGFEEIQAERINRQLQGFESFYKITKRLDKKDALQIMSKAHIFLMFSHKGIKGVTSSKVFDYIAFCKPILLYPQDHDILDEIIIKTGSGIGCNDKEEILEFLKQAYNEFLLTGTASCNQNVKDADVYSRKNQAKLLANMLDRLSVE